MSYQAGVLKTEVFLWLIARVQLAPGHLTWVTRCSGRAGGEAWSCNPHLLELPSNCSVSPWELTGEAFYMILLSCCFPGKPLNTVKLKLWKNRVVRMVPGINRAVKHKSAPLALRTVFSQSVSWALYKLDLSITSNWVSGSCLTHSQFSTDVSLLLLGSKFASCFP